MFLQQASYTPSFGGLGISLRAERKELSDLRDLRDKQLASIKSQSSTLVATRIDQIGSNIAGRGEPFLSVSMSVFNGSVFELEIRDIHLEVRLDGHVLAQAPILESGSTNLYPGGINPLVYRQPIQPQTSESLMRQFDSHDIVVWLVRLRGTLYISRLGESVPFHPPQMEKRERLLG